MYQGAPKRGVRNYAGCQTPGFSSVSFANDTRKKKDSFMTGRDDNDGEEGEEHLMPLCVPRFQLQIRGPQRNESRDSQEINPEMSLRATRVRRRKKK
jgi:hypothetical protein